MSGGLPPIRPQDLIRVLTRHFGCAVAREGKRHTIVTRLSTQRRFAAVDRHRREVPRGTLAAILKALDIEKLDFLNALKR